MIGAHPGYPDPDHFGRRSLQIAPETLAASIRGQVAALDVIARAAGARLHQIKPHGALYNDAARDLELAACIARAVVEWKSTVVLVGLAASRMLDVWREQGFRVASEAFADRRYEPGGTLRSRQLPGALLTDPDVAAAQALSLVADRRARSTSGAWIPITAETLCLHGDTATALATAQCIRSLFVAHGIQIAPVSESM